MQTKLHWSLATTMDKSPNISSCLFLGNPSRLRRMRTMSTRIRNVRDRSCEITIQKGCLHHKKAAPMYTAPADKVCILRRCAVRVCSCVHGCHGWCAIAVGTGPSAWTVITKESQLRKSIIVVNVELPEVSHFSHLNAALNTSLR